jgi:phenylacetate-CoA ligase
MRPRVLVCYTQAGADLARYVLDRGLRDWDAIAVLCCAERLSAADRRVLVDAFGPDVFETYGSREVMLIGAECEAHQGLHLSLENLICEVVVRGEGGPERPAAPGESGEVVITDLHNYGMPLVRYALGDVAVAGSSEPCPCGRTLPRLGAVEGRVTETLRDASGQRVSGMLFNLIFSPIADKVGHFQAVQHRDGSITLRFVRRQGFDEAAGAHIQRQCDRFLRGVPVRMEAVPEIPPGPGGKRKVVVVEG